MPTRTHQLVPRSHPLGCAPFSPIQAAADDTHEPMRQFVIERYRDGPQLIQEPSELVPATVADGQSCFKK
jgi:hypothetical protein